jgi:pyruvate/2-oxoglutarate dehydrogenase complex dihydrolipoamide dehydrogenase (E3) component
VELDGRGFVRVDDRLCTSNPRVFAAGDVTRRPMLVSQALQDGFDAATNAVKGRVDVLERIVCPIGSFTDPEYAKVGLTEAEARSGHEVVVAVANYDCATRPIIDGRTFGFCKLVVDRPTSAILGCHVVGERAVDIVQSCAIAMAARMPVDVLARIPLSFPTYTGILGRAAAIASRAIRHGDPRDRLIDELRP